MFLQSSILHLYCMRNSAILSLNLNKIASEIDSPVNYLCLDFPYEISVACSLVFPASMQM